MRRSRGYCTSILEKGYAATSAQPGSGGSRMAGIRRTAAGGSRARSGFRRHAAPSHRRTRAPAVSPGSAEDRLHTVGRQLRVHPSEQYRLYQQGLHQAPGGRPGAIWFHPHRTFIAREHPGCAVCGDGRPRPICIHSRLRSACAVECQLSRRHLEGLAIGLIEPARVALMILIPTP
jgi:hypothetical protein